MLSFVCSAAAATAQTGPQPQAAAPQTRQRPATQAYDPASGIASLYGTSNLAKGVSTVVTTDPKTKLRVLSILPSDLLAAQNKRRQPPPTITDYTIYTHNDDLLRLLSKVKSLPNLDPTLPVILAWNHVALDMTSIDHTTAGNKIKVSSAPKGELPVFEPTYAEQFGPPRSSRAMAIVHLAIFEAVNTIDPRYTSYKTANAPMDMSFRDMILQRLGQPNPLNSQTASIAAAISEAAYRTLVALYPKKAALLDASKLQISLLIAAQEQVRGEADAQARIAQGSAVGVAAAATVNEDRKTDKSDVRDATAKCGAIYAGQPPETFIPEPLCYEGYFPDSVPAPADPFSWTIDPVLPNPLKLGINWGQVRPFVVGTDSLITSVGIAPLPGSTIPVPKSTDQRVQDALNQSEYGNLIPDPHKMNGKVRSQYGVREYGAFNPPTGAVITYPSGGGARASTPGKRSPEQTREAQFWGYDATALLCAPPRLYNMIATSFYLDKSQNTSFDAHAAVKAARYLALVNLALGDAGVTGWAGKYMYNEARPVTYIRDHVPPGNAEDPTWTPLGQVASNGLAPNTTPPFPAYPSGHAVFGAAAFEMMGKVLELDPAKTTSGFDFVSDEYNGFTFDYNGKPRPFFKAHFVSLDAAKWENAESRIWLGVHWQQDADDGVALGNAIADQIFMKALQPLPTS